MIPPAAPPLLEMRGITKSFPGVQALRGVDLELRSGEVLALLGENGAGKSTLIKILAGAHQPDGGEIRINGAPITMRHPLDATRAGVAVIYQEFNLIPSLTVSENIFLGRELTRSGFIQSRREFTEAEQLFQRIGVTVDPAALCKELTIAQQQVVEIAKALSCQARIIVMDEPSATLTPNEVERLFVVIRDLQARGISIIYISHRLEEIYAIADRITVLRDGCHVATRQTREVNRAELIELMVGRKLEQEFPRRQTAIGAERLVVKNLNRGRQVRDISFSIRQGEVLGLTGLVGAGRTEAARAIFGADDKESGSVELDGQALDIRNPADAIAAGIGFLTEDRKAQGLILGASVRENFGLPNLARFARHGFVNEGQERRAFAGYVESLGIKIPHAEQAARNLSGGNQQKVVLAKWLERDCEVIIFDEPTRGIDVGAKYEVYQLINQLAAQGKAVLLISSELPEVLGMCDRILVMHEGRIRGEIADAKKATQEEILALAIGRTD